MKTVVLTILDGIGNSDKNDGNAYLQAAKPNIDELFSKYSVTELNASGNSVGLPDGQMGNSEVGHLNIGAGRVVYQPLERINIAVKNNTLKDQTTIKNAIAYAKKNGSNIHILGLLSDGGVHSHINHYIDVLKIFDNEDLKVVSHVFLDGRDVAPKSAINYVKVLDEVAQKMGNGFIQTVAGRYYAMDRDKRYERTQSTYEALVLGNCKKYPSAIAGIEDSYDNDAIDEFVKPFVVGDELILINDNDVIVNMNFRPDRAIQLSQAFTAKDYDCFDRKKFNKGIHYVSMTPYSGVNSNVIFEPEVIKNGLGEFLSNGGYKQLRIAETEKYAHVTFFFDGGEEKDYANMKKVLIESPKSVATYDLKPEMSAFEVCDNVLKELDNEYDVIILNFANPDMVGHTGNMEATIKAIETVDECVGKVYEKVMEKGAVMIITSDHGNSELLVDENGNTVTSHTTNKVPFCITKESIKLKNNMSLCDIAPTILDMIGVEKPKEMTGNTIIKEEK